MSLQYIANMHFLPTKISYYNIHTFHTFINFYQKNATRSFHCRPLTGPRARERLRCEAPELPPLHPSVQKLRAPGLPNAKQRVPKDARHESKQPNSTARNQKLEEKKKKKVSDLALNPRILIIVGDLYRAATGTTSTNLGQTMKTLILAAEKRPVFLKERHPTLSSWPPRTSPKSLSHGCLDTQVPPLCLSEFQDHSHSFTQIAQLNGIQCISRPTFSQRKLFIS